METTCNYRTTPCLLYNRLHQVFTGYCRFSALATFSFFSFHFRLDWLGLLACLLEPVGFFFGSKRVKLKKKIGGCRFVHGASRQVFGVQRRSDAGFDVWLLCQFDFIIWVFKFGIKTKAGKGQLYVILSDISWRKSTSLLLRVNGRLINELFDLDMHWVSFGLEWVSFIEFSSKLIFDQFIFDSC